MNISGLEKKIASKADLLGKLYGYLMPMVTNGAQYGQDPLTSIMGHHQLALEAVMKGKFIPNLKTVVEYAQAPFVAGNVLKNGLIAYIIGELGGGFIGSKNATAIKKFGENTIKYGLLSAAVVALPFNPHPPADTHGLGAPNIGMSSGNSPSWGYRS